MAAGEALITPPRPMQDEIASHTTVLYCTALIIYHFPTKGKGHVVHDDSAAWGEPPCAASFVLGEGPPGDGKPPPEAAESGWGTVRLKCVFSHPLHDNSDS